MDIKVKHVKQKIMIQIVNKQLLPMMVVKYVQF